jgi:hypothetical protein
LGLLAFLAGEVLERERGDEDLLLPPAPWSGSLRMMLFFLMAYIEDRKTAQTFSHRRDERRR